MFDTSGNWPEWVENAVKVASAVLVVGAVVAVVATVPAVTVGTGGVTAFFKASVALGAALSGINGGVANEAAGNSYVNGYIGGAIGGAIQSVCSRYPGGTTIGGGVGVTVGTAVTCVMNCWDQESSDLSLGEIAAESFSSGSKALLTSAITESVGIASDIAIIDGAGGLLPSYTYSFGEAVKTFFGWLDDAVVYCMG